MHSSGMDNDQATGLRRIASRHPVRVIAVTSGKGGVGKTNISVNLGVAMAISGKNVMLLDADFGLANIDVLLGLHPPFNISHVLSGERTLQEILVEGPVGMKIVPASSGIRYMADLSDAEHAGLINAFSDIEQSIDILIIDTAAGITDGVTTFTTAAQEVVVVVCDEPASITDAYAMIKVLHRDRGIQRFRVVANMVGSYQEGQALYTKLVRVTDKFLDVTLDFLGVVPYDEILRRAVQRQKSVVEAYPRSKAALAFKNMAKQTDKWHMPTTAKGHLEFFLERLIQAGQAMEVPVS